jgi:hypothetical protein
MNKEIEKHLIPDLSNIVMDYISGTKEYWRTQMNKSIEQFKTRRLSIYTNDEHYKLTLFLRHITDDKITYETDDNDYDKFYLKVGCKCNRYSCSRFINDFKRNCYLI